MTPEEIDVLVAIELLAQKKWAEETEKEVADLEEALKCQK